MDKKISLYEILSLLLEFVGFIAVILSLIFVGRQLRSSSYAAVIDKQLKIQEILFQYPELRAYFEGGKQIQKGDDEYDRVIAIADYYLDFFDLFWGQGDDFLSMNDEAWESWENYIGDTFNTSPILCERLKEVNSWYETSLIKFIDESAESAKGTEQTCYLEEFYEES